MGVVRDVTIDQLTQAVQGISTSGMSDSTGQAINTTLGTLGKDTSLQAINTTLQLLVAAISPSAVNVTFDNTGTGLSASNVQAALQEINNNVTIDTCSIQRASGTPSTVPLPTIYRTGNIVIVDFNLQLPAGTYGNTVWKVTPTPTSTIHAIVYYANTPTRISLYNTGELGFSVGISPSSASYINGQIVFIKS